ncbi:hypothetical protein GOBAR_DD35008 [Gossypium barbadense]|nr:hypothetical protein GOBAR_DD35008 [Gossypium barbadense]
MADPSLLSSSSTAIITDLGIRPSRRPGNCYRSMARLIRSLRQWPPLQLQQQYHCCSRILTVSTKTPVHCFSFATSTSSRRNARLRPRGTRLPNAPSTSDLRENEISDDSESDVKKSRNQKKREARRAVRWGMDLASFSTPQIKLILRASSLEQDVFDALMLVKRLGPDVREGKRRQFNYIGKLLREVEPELMEVLIQATKQSQEFVNTANRWNCVNLFEVVQTSQEQSQNVSEEEKAKIEAAVRSARKSLTRFLRTLAKQLTTEESFD